MNKKRRNILIALGRSDPRLHRGVERYAQEHGWHLSPQLMGKEVIPWGWKGNGILCCLGKNDELAKFVKTAKVPAVNFSHDRLDLKIPQVIEDNAHAAQVAAKYFLKNGFVAFMFYSKTASQSHQERSKAFIENLKFSGRDCTHFQWHQPPFHEAGKNQWKVRRCLLASHLKKANKPLAIFTGNDDDALEALEVCEGAKLKVPEAVTIIGAGNHFLSPNTLSLPISSADINRETVGYRGFELLDGMISGFKPAPPSVKVPVTKLVIRQSNDSSAVKHEGVLISLRFIQERLHETIVINDLARAADISPRSLYNAFLKHMACTPGEALRNSRLERAQQLLAERSDYKLAVVAEACGYSNAGSLCNAFSQFLGMTPNSFRKINMG